MTGHGRVGRDDDLPLRYGVHTPAKPAHVSLVTSSAHCDEDAEHDSNECREGHRLDEHAQASCGEEPLGQRALDGKVSQGAFIECPSR